VTPLSVETRMRPSAIACRHMVAHLVSAVAVSPDRRSEYAERQVKGGLSMVTAGRQA